MDAQPADFYGKVGDTAAFSVIAQGTNLTYQWQVSSNRGASWSDSTANGYNTNRVYLGIQNYHLGYYYRCKITDSAGHVIYSEPGEIVQATENWSFTYNADGMRTQRTNGTTTYKYTYHNSQLTHMDYNGTELHFYYDASGSPLSVIYNNETYYYVLNLQGDVVAILDSSGTQVVAYTYDAWGKPLSISGSMASTLGQINPLRYRGYIYDQETNLYYLQSRYYNPTWGRFINADSLVSTGQGVLGYNMFAYCSNNPVDNYDPSGHRMVQRKDLAVYSGYSGSGFSGADLLTPLVVGAGVALGGLYEVTKEEFKRLSKALVDTAKARYENSQPAIHHVVPQRCPCEAAQNARNILDANSISAQDPLNLVIINYETHKQLHSSPNGYCKKVETVLNAFAEDKNIRGGLALIKLEIAFLALSNGSYCIGIW